MVTLNFSIYCVQEMNNDNLILEMFQVINSFLYGMTNLNLQSEAQAFTKFALFLNSDVNYPITLSETIQPRMNITRQ